MSCISASLVPRVVSSRRAGRSRGDARDDPRAEMTQPSRRKVVQAAGLGSLFPWGERAAAMAGSGRGGAPKPGSSAGGLTNETVKLVNGMRHKRMGGGDIVVSEFGLGTQRWGGADFNSPDESLCHQFLDRAVLEKGVSLIDTAEQYPIPSDRARPEGNTERIIGSWLAKDKSRREKVVLATKITGGSNVTKKNIVKDLEGSLRRFGTDYVDVYTLHWPARYTPQSNWGQSLQYHREQENAPWYRDHASFEEIAEAMSDLIDAGKLRGWGMCNDNAYGLTASCYAAYALENGHAPCVMQNDFSLINRRVEENGVTEASSPANENVGFMAYNVLAGGVLTGKYLDVAAAVDNPRDPELAERLLNDPRGRMDDYSWGKTLYRYRSGPAGDATRQYAAIADAAGVSLTELALRWCRARDGVTSSLIGHTSMAQLDETLACFDANGDKGKPLPADVAWEIDRVHMRNRLPIFASDRVGRDWDGAGEIGERVP